MIFAGREAIPKTAISWGFRTKETVSPVLRLPERRIIAWVFQIYISAGLRVADAQARATSKLDQRPKDCGTRLVVRGQRD